MPIGIITDVAAVLIGTVLGASIKKFVPESLLDELPKVFGICAFSIGVVSLIGVETLPMVIMATICGFVIGELLHMNVYISKAFSYVLNKLPFHIEGDHDEYMETYLLVVLMFCMSGTGIFGALTEGMSGDSSVLVSKAVLDFFSALLFGAVLGFAQTLVAVPQFAILLICFFIAQGIAPFLTTTMINDFKACGGIITMITGLSVSKILKVNAINLAPALIIVMPLVGIYAMI